MNKRGFTLVELLVVIAILGLLVAILLPSLSSARTEARRVTCAAQLRQVGVAIQSYMESNQDHLPTASYMPSMSPWPIALDAAPTDISQPGSDGLPDTPDEPQDDSGSTLAPGALSISDVLAEHVNHQTDVFRCPEDTGAVERPEPNEGKSYFETEKSSYEFRRFMWGLVRDRLSARYERFTGRKVANNMIWIMRDYNNFHGDAGTRGSRRYLYVDGHVTDYEN